MGRSTLTCISCLKCFSVQISPRFLGLSGSEALSGLAGVSGGSRELVTGFEDLGGGESSMGRPPRRRAAAAAAQLAADGSDSESSEGDSGPDEDFNPATHVADREDEDEEAVRVAKGANVTSVGVGNEVEDEREVARAEKREAMWAALNAGSAPRPGAGAKPRQTAEEMLASLNRPAKRRKSEAGGDSWMSSLGCLGVVRAAPEGVKPSAVPERAPTPGTQDSCGNSARNAAIPPRRGPVGGLDSLVEAVTGGNKKISTFEKSRRDWAQLTSSSATLQEELHQYRKSGGTHLEKQRFLERADWKSHELEMEAKRGGK